MINVYEGEQTQPTQPTQPSQPTQPPQTTQPTKSKSSIFYIAAAIVLSLLGAGVYELSKKR